ncbi:MAG: hypothetical protein P8X60_11140 [Robiginitalea sp.]
MKTLFQFLPFSAARLLRILFVLPVLLFAQQTDSEALTRAASGLEFRGIGPSVMGGRIADIAVHPQDPSTWYLAVGSGGVWKTSNRGTTWEPVFDDQSSYSTGTVTPGSRTLNSTLPTRMCSMQLHISGDATPGPCWQEVRTRGSTSPRMGEIPGERL